ncbi:MAG: membrane protein insertase YidC [Arachnia propionica]|uniref:membrane protein insertase YidC n=1 Tax=Arachnia propionica TaxID=1750 RepID=UPI0026FE98AA|nr:membrane protein insertase YidC [Arachnia propionica]
MIELLVSLSIWDGIYGLLSAMMQPIYWVISGILVLFHALWAPLFGADSGWAWAMAIICMTLLVRTLMIPLFVKSTNSSRALQMLQPKMEALKKKYGSDQMRFSQEVQKLYAEEGVNPMASCFPMLLQMPVMLSLYRVLQGVADNQVRGQWLKDNPQLVESLQQAQFLGADLSGRIFPLSPFGMTQILGVLLVVLMVVTLFITQLQLMRKNMPPEALTSQFAQTQKIMLYGFPIIYALTSTFIPIGVLLYWTVSNIWTMGQQGLLIRNNPAPNTPAYIDWEERMRAKGKDPEAIMKERAAKRRKGRPAPVATSSLPEVDERTGRRKVTRQQVSRSTVRTTDSAGATGGTSGGGRRQPRATTRAARKKK